jgi:hypothetical protein
MIIFTPLNLLSKVITITHLLLLQIYLPAIGQTCDFNSDLSCNCVDIDLLNNEIATGGMSLLFDIDGDNDLDFDDKLSWLSAVSSPLEDVNLDGLVSPLDLLIIVSNFNSISSSHCSGDINADGMINDTDAAIFLDVFTGGMITWLGTSDSDWHNPSNWDVGLIPIPEADISISNAVKNPVVIQTGNTGNAESLLISITSSLTIQNGGALSIQGSLDPLSVMGEILIEKGGVLDVSTN